MLTDCQMKTTWTRLHQKWQTDYYSDCYWTFDLCVLFFLGGGGCRGMDFIWYAYKGFGFGTEWFLAAKFIVKVLVHIQTVRTKSFPCLCVYICICISYTLFRKTIRPLIVCLVCTEQWCFWQFLSKLVWMKEFHSKSSGGAFAYGESGFRIFFLHNYSGFNIILVALNFR